MSDSSTLFAGLGHPHEVTRVFALGRRLLPEADTHEPRHARRGGFELDVPEDPRRRDATREVTRAREQLVLAVGYRAPSEQELAVGAGFGEIAAARREMVGELLHLLERAEQARARAVRVIRRVRGEVVRDQHGE